MARLLRIAVRATTAPAEARTPGAAPRALPAPPPAAADSGGRRTVDPGVSATGSTSAEAARRAADLHQRALEAGADGRLGRAASLHQKAAALHAADDGRGSRCLELAGSLQYANGERRAARASMESAAELALARGDVVQAADAYVKASIIAYELRDGAGGVALARRARRLADSPLLSADQRAAIAGRIVGRR